MTNTLYSTTTNQPLLRSGGVGWVSIRSKRLHRSGVVLIARNAMNVGGQHGQQRKHNEVLTLREVMRMLKCRIRQIYELSRRRDLMTWLDDRLRHRGGDMQVRRAQVNLHRRQAQEGNSPLLVTTTPRPASIVGRMAWASV